MRESVKSANWSNEREVWYKKECEDIIYKRGIIVLFEENDVFLEREGKRTILLTINNPKAKWFEIWLQLREI